jgi:uncharacterized Fe-S center protein
MTQHEFTRRDVLKTSAAFAAGAMLASPPVAAIAKTLKKEKNMNEVISKVFFTADISPAGLIRVYEALDYPVSGKNVAVKISTGEPGGHNYLHPELIGDFVKKVNGVIVECNTAYHGKRAVTKDSYQTAIDHGFTKIAKVDILDADGETALPIRNGKWLKEDLVGSHLLNYDFVVNLAHFKGHMMAGLGGVLKNQSIGFASPRGKALIHTAGEDDGNAFGLKKGQDAFLESMAEAASAVADHFGKNIIYINVANKLSVDCDCDSNPHDPEMGDIGIFASLDPVACDKAAVDAVYASPDKGKAALIARMESKHGIHTIDHAAAIGMGSLKYEIVKV